MNITITPITITLFDTIPDCRLSTRTSKYRKMGVVHPNGMNTVQKTTPRCTMSDAQQDNCVGSTAKSGAWITC